MSVPVVPRMSVEPEMSVHSKGAQRTLRFGPRLSLGLGNKIRWTLTIDNKMIIGQFSCKIH